jgi:2-oxoglutarate ferredoxin oxidoreductase subunit beta
VAQAFAGNIPTMVAIMKEAIAHKGFAIVNILQPCVTFDKVMTYKFYLERIFSLPAEHDRQNLAMALSLVMKAREEEKFPVGVLYQKEKATYTEEHANLKAETLLDKKRYTDFKTLMAEFR